MTTVLYVPNERLELSQGYPYCDLNAARLPIPPLRPPLYYTPSSGISTLPRRRCISPALYRGQVLVPLLQVQVALALPSLFLLWFQ